MKTYKGIWMDRDHASIVTIAGETAVLQKIKSKIHNHNVKGGSRTSTPYGPQGAVSEKASLQRFKNEMRAYFKELKSDLQGADGIYIFGPAKTKVLFFKDVQESKALADKVLCVDQSDSMTDNQIIAQVKKFFKPLVESTEVIV